LFKSASEDHIASFGISMVAKQLFRIMDPAIYPRFFFGKL